MRHETNRSGTRSGGQSGKSRSSDSSESELREPVRIAGVVYFLVLVFLLALFAPLYFGASGGAAMLRMGLAAGVAAVCVAGAGAGAYFVVGTSRAVNVAAACAIALSAGGLFLNGWQLGQEAREAREQAALAVLREAQVAYRHAVTYSGSGWWEMSGPTASHAFTEPLARFPGTAVARLVESAMPVIRELEGAEEKYRESVKAFHDAGGLAASTLKTRAQCEARLTTLKAMARESAAEMDLLEHLAERVRAQAEPVKAPMEVRETTIGVLASGPQLAAALSIHQLDHAYAERAIKYLEFLRVNSGKWTITSQDNTIYLGYEVSRDEFLNLQRAVNEIADRQLAVQRSSLEVPPQKLASGRGRGTDVTGSARGKPAEKQTEAGVR